MTVMMVEAGQGALSECFAALDEGCGLDPTLLGEVLVDSAETTGMEALPGAQIVVDRLPSTSLQSGRPTIGLFADTVESWAIAAHGQRTYPEANWLVVPFVPGNISLRGEAVFVNAAVGVEVGGVGLLSARCMAFAEPVRLDRLFSVAPLASEALERVAAGRPSIAIPTLQESGISSPEDMDIIARDLFRSLASDGAAEASVQGDPAQREYLVSAGAWQRLAMTLYRMRRFGDALAALDKILGMKPDDADALNVKAVALAQLGKHSEALEVYQEALKAGSPSSFLWLNIGVQWEQLLRDAEAIEAYEEALRLNPADAAAWANMAQVLTRMDRHESAAYALRQATRLTSKGASRFREPAVHAMFATGETYDDDDNTVSDGGPIFTDSNWRRAMEARHSSRPDNSSDPQSK